MKNFYLLVACLLIGGSSFAAKPPAINQKTLKEAFEDTLKDADSAKFKDLTQTPSETAGAWRLCGSVNAKNSYGAYGGYEPFLGMTFVEKGKPVQYVVLGMGEAAGMVCRGETKQ